MFASERQLRCIVVSPVLGALRSGTDSLLLWLILCVALE